MLASGVLIWETGPMDPSDLLALAEALKKTEFKLSPDTTLWRGF